MTIILNHSSMVPIYEQLVNQIKSCIVSGELLPGSALPSVRTLSAQLQISALTVKKAYDHLEEEGIIVTVHGKGSFVAENNLQFMTEVKRREIENMFSDAVVRARTSGFTDSEIRDLLNILLEEH